MLHNVHTNHPLQEVFKYRESGYTDKLLEKLLEEVSDKWDVYLYFELSRWKGNDLRIEPSPRKKVVLCIADESPRTNYPFLDEVDIVFRMYLPEGQIGKIFHLPVGPSRQFIPESFIPFNERKYNVFFSGNLHQGRAALYTALTGLPTLPFALLHRLRRLAGEQFDKAFPNSVIRFSKGFHNGIPPHVYAQYLGASKIILCPAGIENPETMRHFEAASLGCVVVTERMPDVPVYRDAPFVVLSSWRDLKPTINNLLREPNRLADLHHETLNWWQTKANATSVVKQVVQQLCIISC